MGDISSIVSVDISANSTTVSRQGFGVPLVLAYHTKNSDLFRAYSSLAEAAADGHTSNEDGYRGLAACFAQDPCPDEVILGRMTTQPAYTVRLEVLSATENDVIKVSYKEPQSGSSTLLSQTVGASSSLAAEATALAALINAVDVDSLSTAFTSSLGVQSATLNGVIANAVMARPYRVTATLNSHADWDATSITITGLGPTGAAQTDTLTVPNGGNATLTSAKLFSKVTSISVPAQSGTNGTATFGTRGGIVGTVASSVYVDVTPLTAGIRVHCYDLQFLGQEETTADAGYDTVLTALQLVNDDWYAIIADSASPANVADIAAWALTAKKLYFVGSPSTLMLAGTPLTDLSGNTRTVMNYFADSSQFNEARYASVGLVEDPGFMTWKFRTLIGATAKTLSTTQINALEADDANYYSTIAAQSIMQQGVTTSGEFIDVVHGIDALEADIKESVFALLVSVKKVPFTTKGLDLIGNAIKGALKRAEGDEDNPGLIAVGTSEVIMPDVDDISDADKRARRLTGVRFSGTLAGAVHFVEIVGTLSV